ncbi:hypothetical protein L345_11840, partial [Ophiophagus hannah]
MEFPQSVFTWHLIEVREARVAEYYWKMIDNERQDRFTHLISKAKSTLNGFKENEKYRKILRQGNVCFDCEEMRKRYADKRYENILLHISLELAGYQTETERDTKETCGRVEQYEKFQLLQISICERRLLPQSPKSTEIINNMNGDMALVDTFWMIHIKVFAMEGKGPGLSIISTASTETNNIEILNIQSQQFSVISAYKTPQVNFSFNEPDKFIYDQIDQIHFILGDFNCHKLLDKHVGKISPHPYKYKQVINLVKVISRRTKPKGCHTQYGQGLTGDTKSLLSKPKHELEQQMSMETSLKSRQRQNTPTEKSCRHNSRPNS